MYDDDDDDDDDASYKTVQAIIKHRNLSIYPSLLIFLIFYKKKKKKRLYPRILDPEVRMEPLQLQRSNTDISLGNTKYANNAINQNVKKI